MDLQVYRANCMASHISLNMWAVSSVLCYKEFSNIQISNRNMVNIFVVC
jgi:hypothetical protein